MTLYSIFERQDPEPAGAAAPAAVAEKFSWLAGLLPPVFMLLNGLWLALLGYLLAVVALYFAAGWVGAGSAVLLYLLLAVFLGFEGHNFRRGALRRRGFVHRAELVASAADRAQLVWLQRRSGTP